MLTLPLACDTGSEELIGPILDIISSNSISKMLIGDTAEEILEPFNEICDAVRDSKRPAWSSFVGGCVLGLGQLVIGVYWMKYSTLSLVDPYASKYIPKGEKAIEVEPV